MMRSWWQKNNLFVFPVVALLLLVPVIGVALVTYQPGKATDGGCSTTTAAAVPHAHGVGLASAVVDGMKLIFNVGPAAELYEVVDGKLQLCAGDLSGDMKHVTLDVIDARLNPGERLPVTIDLVIRRADETVLKATAPAMYSPGHGYHFGDNYLLPAGATYDWTATISPVQALRQEGAQGLWLDPVEWSGQFTLDESGAVVGKAAGVQVIGNVARGGIHITLGQQAAVPLYAVNEDGTTRPEPIAPHSRYFVVDVTDHAVNVEEKLPGAEVTLTFRQGDTAFDAKLAPVISPAYGFHYGANVSLEPGTWQITVTVGGLDFLRHAGAATTLARRPISATFEYTMEDDE